MRLYKLGVNHLNDAENLMLNLETFVLPCTYFPYGCLRLFVHVNKISQIFWNLYLSNYQVSD